MLLKDPPSAFKVPVKDREGLVRDLVYVSKEDYDAVSKHKWHLYCSKTQKNKYAVGKVGKVNISMHVFLYGYPEKSMKVDHIGGNGLINTRVNLRAATSCQNNQNRIIDKTATSSSFTGVTRHGDCWTARCEKQYIGYFKTETAAAVAYDKYALVAFGPGTKTNGLVKPQDVEVLSISDCVSHRAESTLPRFIKAKGNKFIAVVTYNGVRYVSKSVATVAGAKKELLTI